MFANLRKASLYDNGEEIGSTSSHFLSSRLPNLTDGLSKSLMGCPKTPPFSLPTPNSFSELPDLDRCTSDDVRSKRRSQSRMLRLARREKRRRKFQGQKAAWSRCGSRFLEVP